MKILSIVARSILWLAVLVLVGAAVWSMLYACNIGSVRDSTDKLFKWNAYKSETTDNKQEETPDTTTANNITFENEQVRIIVPTCLD